MSEYSYIGIAADISSGAKFLVRSIDCPIYDGNIVEISINGNRPLAEVLKAAFLRIGCEEEAMLAEFCEIHPVEKIYGLAWRNKTEVTEDGN